MVDVGWEGYFTAAVIVVAFIVLLADKAPADFVMLLAVTILMLCQIISTEEGLAGFANSAVLTVAILYVVAAGINSTGALEYFFNKALGKPKMLFMAQLRLMIPVGIVSAFLNNTPVVAIMIPIVQRWCRKVNLPVSQLFIPLSFASILGGTCTLIGTSTNLVIAGKYEENYNGTIGLFDLGSVGVPTLLTGFSYIVLFSPMLLPGFAELDRRCRRAQGLDEGSPEGVSVPSGIGSDFTVACKVSAFSPVVGKAVDEAGLRSLKGLYLTSVQRQDRMFSAVGPEFVLHENDLLFFTGLVDKFDEFCLSYGFEIITDANEDMVLGEDDLLEEPESMEMISSSPQLKRRANTFDERIVKALVSSTSELVGKTAKESKFRRRFDAAIISLFRPGHKSSMHGNLGRMVLQVGDVLLLVVGNSFSWENPDTSRDLKPYVSDAVAMQVAVDDSVPAAHAELVSEINLEMEREFLIPMRVTENPKLLGARSLVGQSIEAAGLRGLPGLFLVGIERAEGGIEHVVSPDAILAKDDILWFAGEREAVSTLRRVPGLTDADAAQVEKLNVKKVHRRLVECVLALRSNMVGKTVREARFRTRFEAAIVGVHRQGRRVLSKIGDVVLRGGDVLILDAGPEFINRYKDDSQNFLLVAEIEDSALPRFDKFYIAVAAIIGMLIVYLLLSDKITLFEPAVIASGVMLVAGCLTAERARGAVSWDVIVIIACAFGLSAALENTNVAAAIGNALVSLAEITNTGWVGVLAAIYLATFMLSIVLANSAAALLMFSIASSSLDACPSDLDEDLCLRQLIFVLMLSASSSFSSPYGYQTNVMVLNCGNYVFKDFLKFGFPLQFWQMLFSLIFVYYCEYWYYSWLISFVGFVVLIVSRGLYDRRIHKSKNIKAIEVKKDSSGTTSTTPGNSDGDVNLEPLNTAKPQSIQLSVIT